MEHHLQDDDRCALCDQQSGTITHLNRWGVGQRAPTGAEQSLADRWTQARRNLSKRDRRAMDSLIVLACWIIWLERDDRIFHNRCKTQSQIVDLIVEHISLWAASC
jgi:hypothetical protein